MMYTHPDSHMAAHTLAYILTHTHAVLRPHTCPCILTHTHNLSHTQLL